MAALILIVEDEDQIAEIIRVYLEREGHRVVRARDGESGVQHLRRLAPDLVILDIKLPRCDGWGTIAAMRAFSDTPIIMVTALGDDGDRVAGLRAGADDYVVKPFNPVELMARVDAVMRRTRADRGSQVIRVGVLEIDSETHVIAVRRPGTPPRPIKASLTQFRLLEYLARVSPRIATRNDLLEHCLPESDALERTIDSHLSKLRRHLDLAGGKGMLEGVRGIGYRLVVK